MFLNRNNVSDAAVMLAKSGNFPSYSQLRNRIYEADLSSRRQHTLRWWRNVRHFVEREDLWSQESATGPCFEPGEYISYRHILFL